MNARIPPGVVEHRWHLRAADGLLCMKRRGTEVWLKVVEVRADDRTGEMKVNGSMKVVDQETGEDLDPTGNKTMQNGGGGGGGGQGEFPSMTFFFFSGN